MQPRDVALKRNAGRGKRLKLPNVALKRSSNEGSKLQPHSAVLKRSNARAKKLKPHNMRVQRSIPPIYGVDPRVDKTAALPENTVFHHAESRMSTLTKALLTADWLPWSLVRRARHSTCCWRGP